MKMTTIGNISLKPRLQTRSEQADVGTPHHGIIVIRKPAKAHTLKLVTVLTRISTIPVKARPIRECTVSILLMV